MPRNIDVEPTEIRTTPVEGVDRGSDLRRASLGCGLGLVLGPVIGALAYSGDVGLVPAGALALAVAVALGLPSVLAMLRRGRSERGPGERIAPAREGRSSMDTVPGNRAAALTWSFTPVGAAVLAATDLVAAGGDLTPPTYVFVTIPCALAAGATVFLTELRESRRSGYSAAKAAAAVALVLVPMPIGGLVGAGASFGHRMLRPPADRA